MRVFHSVCVCVCVCVSDGKEETEMVGPIRPQFVLFGSSVVQLSYSDEGWGAILTDIYARKVLLQFLSFFCFWVNLYWYLGHRYQFIQNNKKEENTLRI